MLLYLGVSQSTTGISLNSGTGSPLVYALFGCVHDINGPDITVTMNDGTCLTSADGWKEFVAGFKDGGEVTFTLNIQYGDDFNDTLDILQICIPFQIAIPMVAGCSDAGADMQWTILFKAYISKVGNKFDFDAIQLQDYTLKITGPVTATSPA